MTCAVAVRSTGEVFATRVRRATTARDRVKGLLGADELQVRDGLLIEGPRRLAFAEMVHTIGMRIPIDVVFCDKDLTVLRVIRSLPPNRLSPVVFRARFTFELPAGSVPDDVVAGTALVIHDSSV